MVIIRADNAYFPCKRLRTCENGTSEVKRHKSKDTDA
jgi:hypothetical protein